MSVKNKFFLGALLFLFFGPLFMAWYLYTHQENLWKKTVNHGTLIQPPWKIPPLPSDFAKALADTSADKLAAGDKKSTTRKWLIVYVHAGKCETACQKISYKLQQVHRSLGKNQRRVERVMLPPTDKLQLENIYLVDPLGNVFMYYPENVPPQDLKDDLSRLLKVSRIG